MLFLSSLLLSSSWDVESSSASAATSAIALSMICGTSCILARPRNSQANRLSTTSWVSSTWFYSISTGHVNTLST